MKLNKYLPTLFIILLTAAAGDLTAQAEIYGDYSLTAAAVLNEDDFESVLNPGNAVGMNNLSLSHNISLKIAAGDGTANFDLWTGLEQQADAFSGTLSSNLNSISLQRAAVSFYAGDYLKFSLGRISLLTGYGYGWNPSDLANPLKNPADADAELEGVDSFMVHFFPDSDINFKIYTILDAAAQDVEYSEVLAGGELSAYLPFGELKITGLYDYDEQKGEDDTVSAAGAALYVDIAGLGVYGEAALLDGSRSQFINSSDYGLYRKDELLVNALGGMEYTFPGGLSAAAEYFYNGEGFNEAEMLTYSDALTAAAAAITTAPEGFYALAALYRPGNYSRHYILLNLMYSVYAPEIDFTSTLLYAADSGTLAVLPQLNWWVSGGLSIQLAYSGLFGLNDVKGSEAELSPADNILSLSCKYSF